MTARTIRESYDGGSIEVGTVDRAARPEASQAACERIVVTATERGWGQAVLHLTAEEVGEHIADLVLALSELDGVTPADVIRQLAAATPGFAEQATPDTRSSAPSVADERATAAGLSTPPAESGRPTEGDALVPCTVEQPCEECEPDAELLASSTPVGGEVR